MVALSTPLLRRGSVVARPSRSPQSCWCDASSSRSFDREQDHVIAETGRHELEAPEPNHRGARNRRKKSGHLEKDGKSVKNTQDPYLAHQLSVFSPWGSHQRVKLVCVLPLPDGDARKDTDLFWFGQEKALCPARGSVYIILHLSACTGVNTGVV